jgi:hypothetical protein
MVETKINAVFEFIAKNPPSIIILGGILGWILCGFTNIPVFCSWWMPLVLIGIALQILWMGFRYKVFK